MPQILRTDTPLQTAADVLVVSAYPDALSPLALDVDAALGGLLSEMRTAREIRGRFGEITVVPGGSGIAARRILVLGLGDPAKLDAFRLVNAYHMAGKAIRARHLSGAIADADTLAVTAVSDLALTARAVATGLLLADVDSAKPAKDDAAAPLDTVHLAGAADVAAADLDVAVAVATAANRTRLWAMLPGNRLTPTQLGERARELFAGTPVTVEVLDEAALRGVGAGGLLGVGQGSVTPPVMITMRYDGAPQSSERLAFVGKGITFDTGGTSIKPAAGMERMKYDMSGAAAVINAVHAIATLGLPVNIIGVTPSAENMPGATALKPGDVVAARNGTTIEVVNTDAEGRVILADALLTAREMGATRIVDVATLTGAVVIALGHVSTGAMSNDKAFAAEVIDAGIEAGERIDPLPMHPEYDVCLESDVADIKNFAGREGSSISAAVFLREFVGDLPWVHLDIAGTAWNDQGSQTQIPKGPSGTPVRTLVRLAERASRG